MRKILPGILAILLAVGFSAFTNVEKNKPFTLYWKNTGPDKAHAVWVSIANQPGPGDCDVDDNNYCYGTAASGSVPTTTFNGDYVGSE